MEGREEANVPLLTSSPYHEGELEFGLVKRAWEESKKLWTIVGPAMVTRVAMNGMIVVTQAFAGHLGDLELAAITISSTVVVGFSFGLLLGMASAMETLCGQAYGAKRYHMLGVYLQRSWIVLLACAVLLLPMYVYATPLLLLIGQPEELAVEAGRLSLWFIPIHFCCALLLPQQRFLQCQGKNMVNAIVSAAVFVLHVFLSWLCVSKLRVGVEGAAMILNLTWSITTLAQFCYIVCGGCPLSWGGFSMEAFSDLWEFLKLSAASGVMLCLENWYYRILVLLAGNMKNAEIAVDALSICMNINSWELMIPLAFFAGTGVRVATELGAGNGKGARFATVISVATSALIGLFFWVLIVAFHDKYAFIFTSSEVVAEAVDTLSLLLAFTVLLNSIQPILSGVAVGSGWQALVAYVNIGSYYVVGVPVGVLLGWMFNLGIWGLWVGMIGGTSVQTLILIILTMRCDWDKEARKASTRMLKTWGSTKSSMNIDA
ncbi:protein DETOXIFICATION 27-like isoform X1 [Canna indica]|uniref:Protein DETOXIFICATION n=1 Tax=Canna indica TaxID=4628 RepID=A0AAQ3KE84_9LILI|nr:protein DETOXIFICATION 27-like isoform X1 [Canna indica]